MTERLPREVAPFFDDPGIGRCLLTLAAPESLTDALAEDLLENVLGKAAPERFVRALHLCDFVVERNSEWHIAPRVREPLVQRLLADDTLHNHTQRRLLALADPDASLQPPDEVPRYLETAVGRTYHGCFLSAESIEGYAQIAEQPLSGLQWLAGRLVSEQVRLGVIPEGAIEVMYLQGMILYRERKVREAEPVLRAVAERPESRHEVAVASHLVGRMDGERGASRKRGEELLRKSLAILQELGDTLGVAQVLHTLGRIVGRQQGRRAEAEEMLRESLEIERESGSSLGVAQVLHTLGQLVGREQGRRAEAEEMLRESLEIGRELHHANHEAQVLYSLSQLPDTPAEQAEELLRESLKINRGNHNASGEQIVQNALKRLQNER